MTVHRLGKCILTNPIKTEKLFAAIVVVIDLILRTAVFVRFVRKGIALSVDGQIYTSKQDCLD
jgi:hypothetical protein